MTQTRRRRSPLLFFAVFTTLAALALLLYVRSPLGRLRMLLGGHTLALLDRVDQAQVYRIDPDWVQNPQGQVIGQCRLENGVDFKGFVITATGRAQGRADLVPLMETLRDARTYQDMRQECDFSPTVAYRLRAGDAAIEVLLDFQCNRLQLLARDAHGKAGRPVYGNLDRAHMPLAVLTHRAFPGDPQAAP
jgi:hypothetical protein